MTKTVFPALLFALLFTLSACGRNRTNQPPATPVEVVTQRTFRQVVIPGHLTEISDQAAFLAPVFWNTFDFSDVEFLDSPDIIQDAFAIYLDVLSHTTLETANASIRAMLTRALSEDTTGQMYLHFLELYRRFLHDPNSPFRNEEFYITVVEHIIENDFDDFATITRAQFDLEMMLKNRVGTIAADFAYITIGGTRGTLHRLNRAFTILYFHNPGCPACYEASQMMRYSPFINHLLEAGRLDILAIFTDDNLDWWRENQEHISPLWINAYDYPRVIRSQTLYDLRAIPSLYLLDRDKRVLLKDADVMSIQMRLFELGEGAELF